MIRGDFIEKDSFEKRPEGSKTVNYIAMWGRVFQAQGITRPISSCVQDEWVTELYREEVGEIRERSCNRCLFFCNYLSLSYNCPEKYTSFISRFSFGEFTLISSLEILWFLPFLSDNIHKLGLPNLFTSGKESANQYRRCKRRGFQSLGERNLLEQEVFQYSCLENSMDREAWQATVHEATESRT